MTTLSFRLDPPTEGNILPDSWNKDAPESYSMKYRHEQSSLTFLVKVIKLANKTIVHGIAEETDKTMTLDIVTADYFSASAFPYTAGPSSTPLVHGFISSARVNDLVSLYKINILQKVIPSLRKEGYEESIGETATASASQGRPQQPRNPRNSPPPVPHQPFNLPPLSGGNNPLSIGRRDLDPLPRNPFQPPPLFGGDDGDGMFVGPSHPLFRERFEPGGGGGLGGMGGRGGRWGGDGWLPPMGAPPGARFDPVGPGPMGGFGGLGRGRGRGGRGPLGGPDNDEFMPPGYGDMFN